MKRILFLLVLLTSVTGLAAEPTFERDILPILNSHCLQCHGGLHRKGELDLRTMNNWWALVNSPEFAVVP